jgi:hypothetical protein
MKYDVIYNKSNGSLTRKSFASAEGAFEFFWKQKGHSPQITSDDLMGGGFDFRMIQGFKSREEGKKFAYLAFLEYVHEMRK